MQRTLPNGSIVHDHEQGTPEWFAARAGKMTASNATAIGNCGKGLETYIEELMAEYFSSADKERFSTKDTERGNELEPIARQIYEFENDVVVEQVGFIEYNPYVGASPDGLVGEVGGTEIKCLIDPKYFKLMLHGDAKIDSDHKWQCQMNLLVTGREWWDLIYYCPNYKQSTCVFRIYPDQEMFDKLKKGFAIGEEMINNIKARIQ